MKFFIKNILGARYPWKVYVTLNGAKVSNCLAGSKTYLVAKDNLCAYRRYSEPTIIAEIDYMRGAATEPQYLTLPVKE